MKICDVNWDFHTLPRNIDNDVLDWDQLSTFVRKDIFLHKISCKFWSFLWISLFSWKLNQFCFLNYDLYVYFQQTMIWIILKLIDNWTKFTHDGMVYFFLLKTFKLFWIHFSFKLFKYMTTSWITNCWALFYHKTTSHDVQAAIGCTFLLPMLCT